jgi:ABC-2 type transport system ATP-binding protein
MARREFWDQIHGLASRGLTVLVSTHYMDEAERCHELACISEGRLIARGTADDIIRRARLVTYVGEGQGADQLADALRSAPGVLAAAPFGQTLHVSGTDRLAIEAAIAPYRREPLRWSEVEPTLEDVFIQLMSGQETGR